MKYCIVVSIFALFLSCKSYTPKCEFISLISQVAREHSLDTINSQHRYRHYILLKKFDKECADSAKIMSIIQYYIDTTKSKPISYIRVDNDDALWYKCKYSKGYEVEESNEHCLVFIKMSGDNKPLYFSFYNTDGEVVYRGKRWQNLPIEFTEEEYADKKKAILKMLRRGCESVTIQIVLDVDYIDVKDVCDKYKIDFPLYE